jgi:hypothetical protein
MHARRKPPRIAPIVPGYDGSPGFAEVKVPDPYERGAVLSVRKRIDILTHWSTRRQIDDAQRVAGEWLQGLHEKAQLRSPSCIDYGKPLVDGGRMQEPLTDHVLRARRELIIVAGVVGTTDYRLLLRVVCEGVSLDQIAEEWGGREPARYIARRVKDALTALAQWRGAQGKERSIIRAELIG